MALSAKEQVDTVLSLIKRDLVRVAQKYQDTEVRSSAANGDLCALVQLLGEIFLTKEQRDQVEQIIRLHHQCCYPLEYQQEGAQHD